jgi:hypothetical protein
MSSFWSTLIGALVGGILAIAGGFPGAWWQTRHADDIARSIHREERREQCLLAFNAKVAEIQIQLDGILAIAETAPLTGQYEAARRAISELIRLWSTDFADLWPDEPIRMAYATLYRKFAEVLPGGTDAMAHYTEVEPAAKHSTSPGICGS